MAGGINRCMYARAREAAASRLRRWLERIMLMGSECYRCGSDEHYARDCTADLANVAFIHPDRYQAPPRNPLTDERIRELADECRAQAGLASGSGLEWTQFRARTGLPGRSEEGSRALAARQAAEYRASDADTTPVPARTTQPPSPR